MERLISKAKLCSAVDSGRYTCGLKKVLQGSLRLVNFDSVQGTFHYLSLNGQEPRQVLSQVPAEGSLFFEVLLQDSFCSV